MIVLIYSWGKILKLLVAITKIPDSEADTASACTEGNIVSDKTVPCDAATCGPTN